METSSSKVTVVYHDPSGVFPLVSRDIAARLPLRSLNWQSPSRPLRQIRQLHVEFVPDNFTETTLKQPVQRTDSTGPNSFEIVRSGKDQRKDGAKERRHQIPGLKTTPYLKLYVLRCDSKDVYKETERKRIREWVREHVQSEGKQGERHTAFEWLILHVVIPDTVAASEPRWRESQSEPDTLKERKTSNLKFPGKSTRTVFDKLRSDFNESSKTAQDRIAQIRLLKSDVPPDLLPTPAVAETLAETPQERENAWKDLMDKFKILILGPFDARVRQYEADIAEQEARRSLPGWNFCTFFIHKEGLAKALESIGLVEDAQAIYFELSVGLETVLRDLASGKAEGTATSFSSYTDDIEARILGKGKRTANGTTGHEGGDWYGGSKLDLFSKDYREQIVRSTISVFDFFCYLFLRQKALILRLANTKAAREELGRTDRNGGEDLVLTSEVCWRASSFIHNNARTLRQDLANGSKLRSPSDIEALVSSWTYAVAEHVLGETAAPVLELTESGEQPLPNGPAGPKRADFGFGLGANPYPQRSSSLMTARKPAPELRRPPSTAGDGPFSPPSSSGTDAPPKGAGIPGLPELATYRAELVMLQRKMLEQLAEQRGWRAGWVSVRHQRATKLQEVNLDDDGSDGAGDNECARDKDRAVSSLILPALTPALASEAAFHTAYEYLSDRAMRYYALATQTKSVEVIVGDLALLRFQQGDLEAAEEYIKHLLPSYASDGWSSTEAEMISIYAECLKRLDRKEAYVSTRLGFLAKVCGKKTAQKLPSSRSSTHYMADEIDDESGSLSEVVAFSARLSQDVTRSLDQYFSDIELGREVKHHKDKDGFALRLRFRHVLDDEVNLDQVSARLVNVDEPNHEIWMYSDGAVQIAPGMVELDLEAAAVASGPFHVDKIIFNAGKLCFEQELQPKPETPALVLNDAEAPASQSMSHKRPFVLLYPGEHAFNVALSISRNVHMDKPRYLEVNVSSGWNEIEDLDLRLRPTSAGLRLHLAKTSYNQIAERNEENAKSGALSLGSLAEHSSAVVKVPYTLEQATPDISLRLEARYHTTKGSFSLLSTLTLRHELPLDVDVDDVFHRDTLFSTFTLRTTNKIPLVVSEASLEDSPVYAVEAPPALGMPMTIFDGSPANLVYKITRKTATDTKLSKKEAALALSVQYIAVDELVAAALHESLAEHLKSNQSQALARLLLPLLSERCQQLFTTRDIEMAAILGQAQVPAYDDFGWQDIVRILPPAVRPELTQCLQTWHNEHTHVTLDYDTPAAKAALRHITISVDVPTVDFVHSVSLCLLDKKKQRVDRSQVLSVGRPVKAQVSIRSTDQWSAASVLGGSQKSSEADGNFVVDVQAEPDTWLVGVQRRAHFAARNREEVKFELTLIPLTVGTLLLPHAEILIEPDIDAEGSKGQVTQPSVSCETHLESSGDMVRVIRDSRLIGVHVAESASGTTQPHSKEGTGTQASTEPG